MPMPTMIANETKLWNLNWNSQTYMIEAQQKSTPKSHMWVVCLRLDVFLRVYKKFKFLPFMTSALCKIFWCVWLDVIVNSACYWVYRNTSITPSATFDFCQLIFDKLSYERLLEYAINLSFYCWSVISFTLWRVHTPRRAHQRQTR